MKVEGAVATTAVLHKVKVKEETKECCAVQQSSPSGTSTTTTIVNAVTVAVTGDTTVSTASTTTMATVAPTTANFTPLSLQTSTIICHPPALTSAVNNNNNNNSEPFPVDPDAKTKGKVAIPAGSSREENTTDATKKDAARLSPCFQLQKCAPQITNGSRSDYKNVGSRSSDNDSPLPPRSLKSESEDGGGGKQDDIGERAFDGNGLPVSNGGSARGISGIFGCHGKLKRLLGTLVQFAMDISPDTGDTVRALVLGLLSGGMTAEDFHSALQEATNFPLRGFVLPYLKHTLPSLQRDLSAIARANNQTCVQYLRSNESAVMEAVGLTPSGESVELFGDHSVGGGGSSCSSHYGVRSGSNSNLGAVQHANNVGAPHHYSGPPHALKRRASDTPYYENGTGLPFDDSPIYGKRATWSHHHQQQQQQQSDPYCWYHPIHSSSGPTIQTHPYGHGHGPSPLPPSLVQINQLTTFGPPQQLQAGHSGQAQNGSGTLDDEWKNIHVMLNCILGMVDKTKRALTILQRRGCSSPASAATSHNAGGPSSQNGGTAGGASTANGSQADSTGNDRDGSLKRLSGEIVAQTIRATEDRVAEVKRRAEEAVQEVKRAAVAEVQRAVAVAVAESRATERLRVHRLLDLPVPQRGHGFRQGAFLRVAAHGTSGPPEPTPRTTTATTTIPTPTAMSSAPLTAEDEKETHFASIVGSSCWNCGRPALETCGGCGVARYCGSFCQHRDWEAGGHHATCNNPPPRDPPRSSSHSPSTCTAISATGNGTDNDVEPAAAIGAAGGKGK